MKTTTTIGCGLAVGLVAASCGTSYRTLRADHCANQDGNDWCRTQYEDGSRPYCSRGISGCEAEMAMNSTAQDGCIAMRPVDDACYSPCGQRMSFGEDASCLDGESSSSGTAETSDTTAGPSGSESGSESSTTGPTPCMVDEDCTEDAAPFCEPVSGECVSCDGTADPDGACAGVDPGLPLCVGGACVACTPENPLVCDEQLLLCDGDTNACVSCTEHGQCGSGACELAVGTCFPEGTVVHVDGDPGAMPSDFPNVAAAVASIGAGLHGVIVVHEQDSGLGYPSVLVDNGRTIALLGAPGESPSIQGTGGNPGLAVEGAGTAAYVEGLAVSGNTMGVGLRLDGAFAWVDRSRIVQNSGGGVLAENGAELTLRNCFVGGGTEVIGIEIIDASTTLLYSTVTTSTFGTTPALGCTAPLAIDIRNSIIVSQGGAPPDEIACVGASIADSATEGTVGAFPVGMPEAWFVNYNGGDFHLQNNGLDLFADIAQWQAGDPLTDIDGDPRPTVDGTPDYAGADVP